MARRRGGRRRGRGSGKIPIISLAILAGQVAYANTAGGSTALGKLSKFAQLYTGYNFNSGQWDPALLGFGYGPWVVKRFATRLARPRAMRGLPVSFS